MRRFSLLLAGLLVLATLAPVTATAQQPGSNCGFPVTLTDATGQDVTIEERPERVVTTNPSAAQTMWEIGGRDQVVGLTQYASYLESADQRTNVSASFGVSVERVVGTEPDLVIAPNASSGDVEPLREAGLTVYHLESATTIEDISRKTAVIGRLTGNCEGAAEANAWMEANVESVRNVTADAPDRPRVLYPLGGGYVAAGDTFIDALFEVVGADNVAADEYSQYPELNDEIVLQLDPEVLVLTENSADLIDQEPYASTTAGERNASIRLRVRDLNQPAPRSVVNSVHSAAEQLHPDRYDESLYVPRSASEGATPEIVITEKRTTSEGGPGFTAMGAIVAALAGALLLNRRR